MTPAPVEILTPSPEHTAAIGRDIGRAAIPGLVIALIGDLGAGKTVFVKGLAGGLDVPPSHVVTSPTYTLMNEYPGRMPLRHADLYRLPPPVDPEEIGLFDTLREDGVTVIEWADRLFPDELADHLRVRFRTISETERKITLIPYGREAENLLERLAFSSFPAV